MNTFIKDNQVLPEEMHGILKTSRSPEQDSGSSRVIMWVVGLLIFLGLVYLAGVWTGKQVQEQERRNAEEELRIERELRERTVIEYREKVPALTPEEREDKIRLFFNQ